MYKVKKYRTYSILLISLILIAAGIVIFGDDLGSTNTEKGTLSNLSITKPVLRYGFDQSIFSFDDYPIKRNAFMGDILMSEGIDFDRILKLERKAEDVYSLRKIKAGKKITFVRPDSCGAPSSFIYEPNSLSYIRYDLDNDICVSRIDKPYEVCLESASGVVTKTLWDAMMDRGFDVGLIDKMEDALAQVYFHSAQRGDQFKLIYERIYVDGKPKLTGKIYSAAYKSADVIDYGFYYESEEYQGYYDHAGTPNKRTFLKAPVKFSRVSSSYNPNRFHPVLKRRKPHLGTDYAAPRGTPIFAVADGVITRRSYTKGNGNYIKIKHDNIYDTQYLHMSRFAKGLRQGSKVKQGQTIGYVGSTGLATGPHVCFRFWKHGRQINHVKENFPPLNPMKDSDLPDFYRARDELMMELDNVPFAPQNVAFAGYAD